LPGDGIGPEVTAAAHRTLKKVAEVYAHNFKFEVRLIGGAAIDETQNPLPPDTVASCMDSAAVFLGAVGGPKWSSPHAMVQPEKGLLELRAELGVYDLIVVRELTGGIYFGKKTRDQTVASDLCVYHTHEIERIVRVAARLAQGRRNKLCSVDKANVLESSRLWRDVTDRTLEREFPELDTETLLVDAAAMHLLSRPRDFDVIVTENMFGDILTDEASMLAGSMGMLPSASLGDSTRGLFEPIHGSAPDIAGLDVANPCAAIASCALLLRHSLGLGEEADAIEAAIGSAITAGTRTADIAQAGETPVSTTEMTDRILAGLG
jgi:3-isopropylmalate dehydrogenase